jgi:hypothetical protein
MSLSINAMVSNLTWESTNISTDAASTSVVNGTSQTIYYWTGATQPTNGGTPLTASTPPFTQGTATVTYSFGNSTTSGAQITLTVTGTGGDHPL